MLKIVHTCLICRVELVYIASYLVCFIMLKKRIIGKVGITIVACYVESMLINVAGQSYILTNIQESILYKDTKCY